MMDAAQREKVDKLWSMAQAVMRLPFRTFKHPAFEEAYRFSSQFPGYKLPSEKRLRTTLLDVNYETVREKTEKKMFDHMVWDKITISCDGWTNRNADNASANILAGKLVRERYPHIIFGGCVAHGLDLLMEDIGKLPWVKEVVNDCKKFIKFIKNHHMTNAMFLDFFSNGATLLKPATTREKALSERCRTSPMHWWAQAGRCAPKLRVIAMNILGLMCAASACERAWSSYAYVHLLSRVRLSIPRQHKLVYIYHNARINNIDQKRERKSAAVLNTFMKSNTQQSILKQRHGTEYESISNPRDAWIPDDVLQENGPEIALSNGDRVRVKTWDWT
ncbi:hypothetical protein R1sor_009367 [Riccia sorocarpa]|uniref:DUF659 domain-containing protein n=1 Tax=Riccia sorocarpa TaxID=122646 RepID=A0ABD3HZ05_9MARC